VPGQQLAVDNTRNRKYLGVSLQLEGRKFTKSIHRLVALAFHPNPNNLPQVNHKDGVRTNNAAPNLEWCTGTDNILHAQALGLIPIKKIKQPHEKPPVLRGLLPKALELHAQGLTRKAISQQLGFSEWTIYKYLKGKATSNNRYTVRHEVTQELMQKMCSLRLEGKSYSAIAKVVGKGTCWVYRQLTALE
jgi:predicted transcriptional regulator